MYLQATLPQVQLQSTDGSGAQFRWLNWIGHNLIDYVEIEIGGQRIDKQYGQWLHIWNELTQEPGKQAGYAKMVGNVPELTNLLYQGGSTCDNDCYGGEPLTSEVVTSCAPMYTLYIPLQFWFCRNPGLSLPLIALQYHEVKINLEFNELKYLVNVTSANPSTLINAINSKGLVSASLFVDYIYLDTEERRRFAQVAHEYLIEQLQFTGEESVTSSSNKIKLDFNHPVKELVWVVQNPSYLDCASQTNEPWRYSDAELNNPTSVAKIQLNGHDRFSEREGRYFNMVQPFQHHTNSPGVGVNVYSFAIRPEDHQPSGSCNFSRIDNAVLNLTLDADAFGNVVNQNVVSNNLVRVYAVNYNVLRIMSGMGGLAYSN
jgi:hypothetical protein